MHALVGCLGCCAALVALTACGSSESEHRNVEPEAYVFRLQNETGESVWVPELNSCMATLELRSGGEKLAWREPLDCPCAKPNCGFFVTGCPHSYREIGPGEALELPWNAHVHPTKLVAVQGGTMSCYESEPASAGDYEARVPFWFSTAFSLNVADSSQTQYATQEFTLHREESTIVVPVSR